MLTHPRLWPWAVPAQPRVAVHPPPVARHQTEVVLAGARVALAALSSAAFWLHRFDPGVLAGRSGALLLLYVLSSTAILLVLRMRRDVPTWGIGVIHVADMAWPAIMVVAGVPLNGDAPPHPLAQFTDVSTLFVLLLFPVLGAAYRWGLREVLATTAITTLLLTGAIAAVSLLGLAAMAEALSFDRVLIHLSYLCLAALIVGLLAETERERRAEAAEVARREALRQVRLRATSAERARLARELHDGAVQSLFGLEMQVEVARQQVTGEPKAAACLLQVQARLHEEGLALRDLMQQMRPLELARHDFVAFVEDTVRRFERHTGIATSVESNAPGLTLGHDVAHELGRIIQEALVNIRRHSGAHTADVRVTLHDDTLSLSIADDGHGFGFSGRFTDEELWARRAGPLTIKERVRELGASLTLDSSEIGSRLSIDLPLSAAHGASTDDRGVLATGDPS